MFNMDKGWEVLYEWSVAQRVPDDPAAVPHSNGGTAVAPKITIETNRLTV